MASIFDVAQYILHKQGAMSAVKLQKLAYYAQAWSLVWDEDILFPEEFEAWVGGPVSPVLYQAHQGHYRLEPDFFDAQGNKTTLSKAQKESIDKVLEFYGDKDPQWLSELTHQEEPWQKARGGLAAMERGNHIITKEHMLEYYSGL